jgi:hypothetical protein
MAPDLIRTCQCREPAKGQPEMHRCACFSEMTGEDLLCDPCRWAKKNGGCVCHLEADREYQNALDVATVRAHRPRPMDRDSGGDVRPKRDREEI